METLKKLLKELLGGLTAPQPQPVFVPVPIPVQNIRLFCGWPTIRETCSVYRIT